MSVFLESSDTFPCFGSRCGAFVIGDSRLGSAEQAVSHVRRSLLSWHERFSRFEPHSELSRLNRDPRSTVPVSHLMARLTDAAVRAAKLTGGLVDATLVEEIERAGYRSHHQTSVPLDIALALAPPRQPAGPARSERWRSLEVDLAARTVDRPPGVQLDSGGIAKGLFADMLGEELAGHESYAVDCGGDLRVGGIGRVARTVRVASPFGDEVLHELDVADGGIATSGIGKRSWIDANGASAHHVLDPATGRPAFTGVVQVTAVAPSGLEAEIAAKAALLSGPDDAAGWLWDGGVIVFDDASHEAVAPHWARAPAAVAR